MTLTMTISLAGPIELGTVDVDLSRDGRSTRLSARMKIHEYQARQILAENGIAVPPAEVVRSPEAPW